MSDEPTAEITRVGRWTYRVVIIHGFSQFGPEGYGWHTLGFARAERKALKELARYVERERRLSEPTIVRLT